jgi:hypothetical protein
MGQNLSRKIKCLELSENENTTYQIKIVLRMKFIEEGRSYI